MEDYGMIVLIATMVITLLTGRQIGRMEERKISLDKGYAYGFEDGQRKERQAQERALAVMRTKYGDDVKIYEKRA